MEAAHSLTSLPVLGGLGFGRRQDGAGRQLGIVGGCVGNAIDRFPALTEQILEQQQNQWGTVVWRYRLEQPEFWIMLVFLVDQVGLSCWMGNASPRPISSESGEWHHGWQYHASSSLEYHFRETLIVAESDAAEQALEVTGPGASEVLCGAPIASEFKVEPQLFRALVLERLRLPLGVTDALCECGGRFDFVGRHRAVCPRSKVFDHGHRAACAERQGQV